MRTQSEFAGTLSLGGESCSAYDAKYYLYLHYRTEALSTCAFHQYLTFTNLITGKSYQENRRKKTANPSTIIYHLISLTSQIVNY